MGGYGSSRWGWYRKKATVEECRILEAARWQREGIIGPDRMWAGGWQWTDAHTGEKKASIGVEVLTGANWGRVRLHYRVTPPGGEGRDLDYIVPLVTTRPHYGGLRWWFRCPNTKCGRRVGKLYMPPGEHLFLCRHCHDLAYQSSQEHDKGLDAYRRLDYDALLELMRGQGGGVADMRAATEILDRASRGGWR